ncbi:MAG: hypothetical protein OEZ59_02100 [Deltaproteobacteria bacterium]|nr:hypothetical protein [Deltaproteobacteria bacterium]
MKQLDTGVFFKAVVFSTLLTIFLMGCSGSSGRKVDEESGRKRCPETNLKVPCYVGPDGLLYLE